MAYLASAWATVLALLLANSTRVHRSPLIMQATSWRMCPNQDDQLFLRLNADMIDWLSPSITNSINPHSITNYTARRQAKTSASSLHATRGPFADKDAMTSPLSLRIVAPTPVPPISWNIEASKLSLNRAKKGGLYLVGLGFVEGAENWVLACPNSFVKSCAHLIRTSGGCICFPCNIAFR